MDRVQELERTVEGLESELANLEVEKDDEISELEFRFEDLGKEKSRLEEEKDDEIADLKKELDDAQRDLEISHAKINILEEEVTRVTAQRDEANRQIEGLEMSFREVMKAEEKIVAQLDRVLTDLRAGR